jgi:alpha-glucosidase
MKFVLSLATLLCCVFISQAKDKVITLLSPDKNIRVTINVGDSIRYQVSYKETNITSMNTLSMTLDDGTVLGVKSPFAASVSRSVNEDVKPLYGMASVYKDHFNEVQLRFKNNFSVVFRAYDNGVAYHFVTALPGRIKVKDEEVTYSFSDNVRASMMKVNSFLNSYEEHYVDSTISFLNSGKIAALPLLVSGNPVKIGISESDLLDYPGLYFTYNGNNGLKGVLPKFVAKDSVGGCCPNFEKIPYGRAEYIAETDGKRSFPWRLMIIAEQDKDLLYNNLVYLLASDNRIGDASWIKPGKVAWDWWNANNLTGVPFKTGFNTDTYKYFIDFAAANGIEYVNMDEGWSSQFDLLKLNDGSIKIGTNAGGGLDMPYLFDYAKKKNVGIILWCVWHTLDRQMNEALDQFEKWGVKGLKVDFMDRDDQTVVNFYERLAKEAAKRKMLVNFHGAFKPTGIERTYPNIINREAVQGLEYNKFTNQCTPDHAAHIPFIRMLAGSMDYTPGGLYNANEKDFRTVPEQPMTQGTRCQQLAMYTLFYAPLEMLSDAPTAYEKEPKILKYLASMPTVWDETIPLDGQVGDYAVIARKKGDEWFVSGITDWTGRKLNVKFDFLGNEKYDAEIFTDGPNANRVGSDYVRSEKQISKGDAMEIEMANGGGFAIRLTPVK